jgi:hypothetical protein
MLQSSDEQYLRKVSSRVELSIVELLLRLISRDLDYLAMEIPLP